MERPVFQPPGTPVEELDTPALVVDLDALERNIQTLQARFQDSSVRIAPFVTPHGCPQIAHMQLAAMESRGRIAVATVGEAEVFTQSGFGSILVANQVVTRSKIGRLTALAASNDVRVAVDSGPNVSALSEAASAAGVTLGILVELDAGLGRCGVAPGQAAVEFGQVCCRFAGPGVPRDHGYPAGGGFRHTPPTAAGLGHA